jgi:hypothetical protein
MGTVTAIRKYESENVDFSKRSFIVFYSVPSDFQQLFEKENGKDDKLVFQSGEINQMFIGFLAQKISSTSGQLNYSNQNQKIRQFSFIA